MRALKLSLIAIATLGLVGASATEAKAAWPVATNGFHMGSYGYFNAFGVPAVRQTHMGNTFFQSIYSPGAYRTTFGPNSITRVWASQSMTAISQNPLTGLSVRITSPTFVGFTFNSFNGFRPFAVPGTTISSGLDSSVTGGVNGIGMGVMGNSFFNNGLANNTIFNNAMVGSLVSTTTGMNLFSSALTASLGSNFALNANPLAMQTTLIRPVPTTATPASLSFNFGSPNISAGQGLSMSGSLALPRPVNGRAPAGMILP